MQAFPWPWIVSRYGSAAQGCAEGDQVHRLGSPEAQLKIAQAGIKSKVQPLKNDPPKIIFSSSPAPWYVDGLPRYGPVKDTPLTRVVNTQAALKAASGTHYLHLFDGYLRRPVAPALIVSKAPPKDAAKAEEQALASRQSDGWSVGKIRHWAATDAREWICTADLRGDKTNRADRDAGRAQFRCHRRDQASVRHQHKGNVFNYLADRKTYVLGAAGSAFGFHEGP
jgi:hypothetical protein